MKPIWSQAINLIAICKLVSCRFNCETFIDYKPRPSQAIWCCLSYVANSLNHHTATKMSTEDWCKFNVVATKTSVVATYSEFDDEPSDGIKSLQNIADEPDDCVNSFKAETLLRLLNLSSFYRLAFDSFCEWESAGDGSITHMLITHSFELVFFGGECELDCVEHFTIQRPIRFILHERTIKVVIYVSYCGL